MSKEDSYTFCTKVHERYKIFILNQMIETQEQINRIRRGFNSLSNSWRTSKEQECKEASKDDEQFGILFITDAVNIDELKQEIKRLSDRIQAYETKSGKVNE